MIEEGSKVVILDPFGHNFPKGSIVKVVLVDDDGTLVGEDSHGKTQWLDLDQVSQFLGDNV